MDDLGMLFSYTPKTPEKLVQIVNGGEIEKDITGVENNIRTFLKKTENNEIIGLAGFAKRKFDYGFLTFKAM